jgi:hypothetical protein
MSSTYAKCTEQNINLTEYSTSSIDVDTFNNSVIRIADNFGETLFRTDLSVWMCNRNINCKENGENSNNFTISLGENWTKYKVIITVTSYKHANKVCMKLYLELSEINRWTKCPQSVLAYNIVFKNNSLILQAVFDCSFNTAETTKRTYANNTSYNNTSSTIATPVIIWVAVFIVIILNNHGAPPFLACSSAYWGPTF